MISPLPPLPVASYHTTCGALVRVEEVAELGGAQEVRATVLEARGGVPCLPARVGEPLGFRVDGAPLAAGRLATLDISYSDSASVNGVLRTRFVQVRDTWAEPARCTVETRLEATAEGVVQRVLRHGEQPGAACLIVGQRLPLAPAPWLHSPATWRYEHSDAGWLLVGELVPGAAGEAPRVLPLPPGGRTGDPALGPDLCVRGGELDGAWLRFTWQSVGCLAHPPPPGPPPLAEGLPPGAVLRWTGEAWVQHQTGTPVPLAPPQP